MGIKPSGFRAEEEGDFSRGIGYCETCVPSIKKIVFFYSLRNNIKRGEKN